MTTALSIPKLIVPCCFNGVPSTSFPFTVDIVKGKHAARNRTGFRWLWIERGRRAIGRPDISGDARRLQAALQASDPALRKRNLSGGCSDSMVRPLPFKTKLALMCEPFDMAVTRLMTTAQKTQYLDTMSRWFLSQGS